MTFSSQAAETEFKVVDIIVCYSLSLIAVAHEDNVKGNSITWNLIEREHFGILSLWKYNDLALNSISLVAKVQLKDRISKVLFAADANEFAIGTSSGKLLIVPYKQLVGKFEEDEFTIALFASKIIGLFWLIPNKILVVVSAEDYIKVMNFEKRMISSEGMLANFPKEETPTCAELSIANRRLYLGSSKCNLLIYLLSKPKYSPEHLYTVSFANIVTSIDSVMISNKYF